MATSDNGFVFGDRLKILAFFVVCAWLGGVKECVHRGKSVQAQPKRDTCVVVDEKVVPDWGGYYSVPCKYLYCVGNNADTLIVKVVSTVQGDLPESKERGCCGLGDTVVVGANNVIIENLTRARGRQR